VKVREERSRTKRWVEYPGPMLSMGVAHNRPREGVRRCWDSPKVTGGKGKEKRKGQEMGDPPAGKKKKRVRASPNTREKEMERNLTCAAMVKWERTRKRGKKTLIEDQEHCGRRHKQVLDSEWEKGFE